jgi:hypothetical protein
MTRPSIINGAFNGAPDELSKDQKVAGGSIDSTAQLWVPAFDSVGSNGAVASAIS